MPARFGAAGEISGLGFMTLAYASVILFAVLLQRNGVHLAGLSTWSLFAFVAWSGISVFAFGQPTISGIQNALVFPD